MESKMKLDKLELSALLGLQARNRELLFMMEQIKLQLEQLNDESKELFSDIEIRLQLEPDSLQDYDVDVQTGALITKQESEQLKAFGELSSDTVSDHVSEKISTNGFRKSDITELEDVD